MSRPTLDVDRLMADLQRRVEERRLAGEYDGDLIGARFSLNGDEQTTVVPPAAAHPSTRPLVGRQVTAARAAMLKVAEPFLADLAAQTNRALEQGRAALEKEAGDRHELELQVRGLAEEVATLREALRQRQGETDAHGAGLREHDARLVALEAIEAAGRLARLERGDRGASDPGALKPLAPPVARLTASRNRFDDGGSERFDAYLGVVDAGGPVLALGGAAAFLARCEQAGVPARGSAADEADPVKELAALPPESLGGLVALRACERFDPDAWLAFVDLAATRLRPGGSAVIEMLNPLTPAGMGERMRDPSLGPAVHPETVAYLLQAAGLERPEVRYLGAFPEWPRLALPPTGGDEELDRVNRIAEHVNQLVLGQPLVAVIARR